MLHDPALKLTGLLTNPRVRQAGGDPVESGPALHKGGVQGPRGGGVGTSSLGGVSHLALNVHDDPGSLQGLLGADGSTLAGNTLHGPAESGSEVGDCLGADSPPSPHGGVRDTLARVLAQPSPSIEPGKGDLFPCERWKVAKHNRQGLLDGLVHSAACSAKCQGRHEARIVT